MTRNGFSFLLCICYCHECLITSHHSQFIIHVNMHCHLCCCSRIDSSQDCHCMRNVCVYTYVLCVMCCVCVSDKTLVSTSYWSRLAGSVFAIQCVKLQCQVNERDNGQDANCGHHSFIRGG